jgi:hypothetical protein
MAKPFKRTPDKWKPVKAFLFFLFLVYVIGGALYAIMFHGAPPRYDDSADYDDPRCVDIRSC